MAKNPKKRLGTVEKQLGNTPKWLGTIENDWEPHLAHLPHPTTALLTLVTV